MSVYYAIAAFSAYNSYQSYKDAGKAAINEAVINSGADPVIAGCEDVINSSYTVVADAVKIFSNSLPKGALKFTISNELSDPVMLFPSIDSGFITKSLNTDSLISCE